MPPPSQETPFFAAQGLAEDRYLRLSAHVHAWQIVAGALLLINGLLAGAWIARSFHSGITPYVVAVNELGQPVAFGPATTRLPNDGSVHRYLLALFVRNARTIVPDTEAQKQLIIDAYAYAKASSITFLNEYYRSAPLFSGLAEHRAVVVTVNTILPLSTETWQLQWTEDEYRSGHLSATKHYQALATVALEPPTKPEGLPINPLGLYITHLSWAEINT